MSYSIGVRAATKALVLEKVAEELNKVAAAQPVHDRDRGEAYEAAKAFVGVLAEPAAGQEVVVSVSGSLGWTGREDLNNVGITASSVTVYASLATAA